MDKSIARKIEAGLGLGLKRGGLLVRRGESDAKHEAFGKY